MPANKFKYFIPAVGIAGIVAGGAAAYLYVKGTFTDTSSPLATAKLVPDEALITAFISTDATWSQLQQFGTPEAQKLIETGWQNFNQQLITQSNIDYDKDLKPWVGSVAIAILPPSQQVQATTPSVQEPDFLMVVGIKDKLSARNFANNLIAVASRNIQDKTVTEWQVPFQGALLAHGWLDQDTVFIALGGPIADAIATPPNPSLDSSATFKAISSSLQQPNAGYFYLNMDKTLSLVNRFPAPGQAMPPETSAVLNSIQGIGMTASSPNKSTSQVELLVALKPKS